jgi:hypothetical protein
MQYFPAEILDEIIVAAPKYANVCRRFLYSYYRLLDRIIAAHGRPLTVSGLNYESPFVTVLSHVAKSGQEIWCASIPESEGSRERVDIKVYKYDPFNKIEYLLMTHASVHGTTRGLINSIGDKIVDGVSVPGAKYVVNDFGNKCYDFDEPEGEYLLNDHYILSTLDWMLSDRSLLLSITYQGTTVEYRTYDDFATYTELAHESPERDFLIGSAIGRRAIVDYMCDIHRYNSSHLGFFEFLTE